MMCRISLFLLFLCSACENIQPEEGYQFILLDKVEAEQIDLEKYDKIKFEPLYIGEDIKEISYEAIGSFDLQMKIFDQFNILLNEEADFCASVDIFDSISIVVDTQQIISYYGLGPFPAPFHPDSSVEEQQARYKAESSRLKALNGYPVIIKNISEKCQVIGQSGRVQLYLESFEHGSWVNIKRPFRGCGETPNLFLPPKNICVTIFPHYENLKSKRLRLKIGNRYTQEFLF